MVCIRVGRHPACCHWLGVCWTPFLEKPAWFKLLGKICFLDHEKDINITEL